MCPARLSTQGPSAASRWSDEEHDILVDLTNEQLELEKKDASKVIPWAKHWTNVSDRLHRRGHSRTSAACLGYWKRTLGAQKANEKAAGPRWDDAEHQILLGMTEEQLELEETDPSAVMSWAKHWKRVSERLKENGYTRSVDACDAYWNLVQDKSPLAAGTGLDIEDESLSSEEPFEVSCGVEANENEESVESGKTPEPPSKVDAESPTVSEPRRTPRRTAEKDPGLPSNEEIETVSPTQPNRTPRGRSRKDSGLSSKAEKESTSPNQPNRTPKKPDGESISPALVDKIKAMLGELGYTPAVNDLPRKFGITKWNYLRWYREQEEEEEEEEAQEDQGQPQEQGHLQEQGQSPEQEQPQEKEKPPEQQEKVEMRVSPQPAAQWSSVNSPRPLPVASKSPSVEEVKTTSLRSEGTLRTAPPEETASVSPAPSTKKPRSTAFRFTPEQRAYLEEKVARTGSNPDVYSRIEMANELGVEEKTIRNWFINHRQKTNRRSLEDRPREDFSYANEYSLSTTAGKRAQRSMDGHEIIEVAPRGQGDPPAYGHQNKKPRLDEELRPNMADQPPTVSPPMSEPINIIRKIAPARAPEEATPNRGPEAPPPPAQQQQQPHIWVQDGPPPPPRTDPLHPARAMHESPYGPPPHPRHSMHPEPSHPHPHSAPRPPPPTHILESQSFQPVNKPPADYEPVTPISWNAKPSASGSSQSQYSNDTKPSSTTPQPIENDRIWASRRVPEIQAQISVLNRDSDSRVGIISRLEQELEDVKHRANALELTKQSEIARVVAEMERNYERDREVLREKERRLAVSREEEMELLRRNDKQVAKCKKKMMSYQALVDLDNDSEGSN